MSTTTKPSWIPVVPKERIEELALRIKPVVTFDRKGRRYIKPVDLFKIAFTWDPEPAKRATGLVALTEITTYHTYSYYGFFKPSIAEVLAQIPVEMLDRVVAFEIIARPESADDLNRHKEALDAGYHVATTRLYGQKQ